jgi:lipoprotein-releasing system permease protein
MRLSSFIAKRIAFNRSGSFSRFIINIAVVATAISVAVMILAIALVNGFQQTIQQKIFSFWGHMHINQYQPNAGPLTEQIPFDSDSNIVKYLKHVEGINTVNAYATKSAIIKGEKDLSGVIFKGVDRHYNWSHLQQFMQSGNIIHFNDSSYAPEIIISTTMAKELQLKVNDPLIIYFIQGAGLPPRARKLKVTGIYKTAVEEYDKTYVIGDLELIRKLNNWPAGSIGGYEVFIDDYHQMDRIAEASLAGIPDKLFLRTIKDIYPNIFDWLALQNQSEAIILIIMTIVAVINMITAILILILERTNMVGVLKALGMRNSRIQNIFIYQAAYIVLAGLIIGDILGVGVAILQKTIGFIKLDEESYYMSAAAIDLHWWQVLLINMGTFAVCLLILSIPAMVTRKITPVKALQFK